MSMADAAKPQPWRVSGMATFSWLAGIIASIARWRRRASERDALRRLSDHDLRDIGLTRSRIMMESVKPFWRA